MTVLIVGADRIGPFIPKLKKLGIEDITHWNTRNCRASKSRIPINTDLVICCTDFLNHNAARQIKGQIKKRELPAVYCRRSWSELAPEVESFMQKKQMEKQSKPPEKQKSPVSAVKIAVAGNNHQKVADKPQQQNNRCPTQRQQLPGDAPVPQSPT